MGVTFLLGTWRGSGTDGGTAVESSVVSTLGSEGRLVMEHTTRYPDGSERRERISMTPGSDDVLAVVCAGGRPPQRFRGRETSPGTIELASGPRHRWRTVSTGPDTYEEEFHVLEPDGRWDRRVRLRHVRIAP